jgi:hypothetical protein
MGNNAAGNADLFRNLYHDPAIDTMSLPPNLQTKLGGSGHIGADAKGIANGTPPAFGHGGTNRGPAKATEAERRAEDARRMPPPPVPSPRRSTRHRAPPSASNAAAAPADRVASGRVTKARGHGGAAGARDEDRRRQQGVQLGASIQSVAQQQRLKSIRNGGNKNEPAQQQTQQPRGPPKDKPAQQAPPSGSEQQQDDSVPEVYREIERKQRRYRELIARGGRALRQMVARGIFHYWPSRQARAEVARLRGCGLSFEFGTLDDEPPAVIVITQWSVSMRESEVAMMGVDDELREAAEKERQEELENIERHEQAVVQQHERERQQEEQRPQADAERQQAEALRQEFEAQHLEQIRLLQEAQLEEMQRQSAARQHGEAHGQEARQQRRAREQTEQAEHDHHYHHHRLHQQRPEEQPQPPQPPQPERPPLPEQTRREQQPPQPEEPQRPAQRRRREQQQQTQDEPEPKRRQRNADAHRAQGETSDVRTGRGLSIATAPQNAEKRRASERVASRRLRSADTTNGNQTRANATIAPRTPNPATADPYAMAFASAKAVANPPARIALAANSNAAAASAAAIAATARPAATTDATVQRPPPTFSNPQTVFQGTDMVLQPLPQAAANQHSRLLASRQQLKTNFRQTAGQGSSATAVASQSSTPVETFPPLVQRAIGYCQQPVPTISTSETRRMESTIRSYHQRVQRSTELLKARQEGGQQRGLHLLAEEDEVICQLIRGDIHHLREKPAPERRANQEAEPAQDASSEQEGEAEQKAETKKDAEAAPEQESEGEEAEEEQEPEKAGDDEDDDDKRAPESDAESEPDSDDETESEAESQPDLMDVDPVPTITQPQVQVPQSFVVVYDPTLYVAPEDLIWIPNVGMVPVGPKARPEPQQPQHQPQVVPPLPLMPPPPFEMEVQPMDDAFFASLSVIPSHTPPAGLGLGVGFSLAAAPSFPATVAPPVPSAGPAPPDPTASPPAPRGSPPGSPPGSLPRTPTQAPERDPFFAEQQMTPTNTLLDWHKKAIIAGVYEKTFGEPLPSFQENGSTANSISPTSPTIDVGAMDVNMTDNKFAFSDGDMVDDGSNSALAGGSALDFNNNALDFTFSGHNSAGLNFNNLSHVNWNLDSLTANLNIDANPDHGSFDPNATPGMLRNAAFSGLTLSNNSVDFSTNLSPGISNPGVLPSPSIISSESTAANSGTLPSPGSLSSVSTLTHSMNGTPIPHDSPAQSSALFTPAAFGGVNMAGGIMDPFVQWTDPWPVNLEEAASTVDKETNDLFNQLPEHVIRGMVRNQIDTMYQAPVRQDRLSKTSATLSQAPQHAPPEDPRSPPSQALQPVPPVAHQAVPPPSSWVPVHPAPWTPLQQAPKPRRILPSPRPTVTDQIQPDSGPLSPRIREPTSSNTTCSRHGALTPE